MRTIARTTLYETTEPTRAALIADKCIDNWINVKFSREKNGWFRTGDKKAVDVRVRDYRDQSNSVRTVMVREPSQAGVFEVASVRLASSLRTINQIEIRLGEPQSYTGPLNYLVSAPRFIRNILHEGGQWRGPSEGDILSPNFISAIGGNADEIVGLLSSPRRDFPIIALSGALEPQREALRILKDATAGFAHVVHFSEDLAYAITDTLGKEWSCYGGALRIYWPRSVGTMSKYHHPLLMTAQLSQMGFYADLRRRSAIEDIIRPIFDASTFVPLSEELTSTLERLQGESSDSAAKAAFEAGEWQALSAIYLSERDSAREGLAVLQAQLNTSLELLKAAEDRAEAQANVAGSDTLDDADETISDAVYRVMAEEQDVLSFSDHLQEQVNSINPAAIAPARLAKDLLELASLGKALKESDGKLGMTTVEWLKARGVIASIESVTKRQSLYRFRVDGVSEEYDLHLKRNEATSPKSLYPRLFCRPP